MITISSRSWTFGLAMIGLFASACATPVGVTRLDEQAAHRELTANVLSVGRPSAYSTQLLERTALSERFTTDPQAVLAELNLGLGHTDERDRLFALSELSFAYAENSGNQPYYLASAVYSYAFLFPQNPAEAPGEYDQRVRLAVDLYNRSVALDLATKDGKQVDLSERQLGLPFGSLSLRADPTGFNYGGDHLTKFVSITDLKVRGLRNTYRRAGIGAALSARVEPSSDSTANRWIPPNAKVPITAFVRFQDLRRAISSYSVPLEWDPSTALAYRLEGAPIWDFELAGFRRGDFLFLGNGDRRNNSGLYMLHPYHPGLIPVVFLFTELHRARPVGRRWPMSCSAIA